MRRFLGPAVLLLLTMTAACASTGVPSVTGSRQDVIAASELASQTGTARQAIQRLRPGFLRVRGPSSINNPSADQIVVYVDNTRMGGVDILDQIQVGDIEEIRHLSAPDATSRFGTGHSAGAIIIKRR